MRFIVVLIALLTALSGTAAAQFLAQSPTLFTQDATDFSFEDDADTGVPTAKEGLAPAVILNAKWINDASPILFFEDTNFDAVTLLAPFGGEFILPGATGEMMAWYGTWSDHDHDEHLPIPQRAYIGVAATSRDCVDGAVGGGTLLPNGDPAGAGVGPIPLPEVPTPAVAAADCSGSEWIATSGAFVAGYASPAPPADTLLSNNVFVPGEGEPNVHFAAHGYREGVRYVAPDTNFGQFFVDASILQTTTVETYVNPLPTSDGERTITRDASEPHDIDVYTSVNPAAEALYTGNVVAPFESVTGCTPANIWICVSAANPDVTAADPTVGPAMAQVLPPRGNEDPGHDYISETHAYFDVHLDLTAWQPLVVAAGDGSNGQVSSDASGQARAPVFAGIYGVLGLWHDDNGDGWIGAPTASPGCPDAHDCGRVQDPNDYGSSEWSGYCRDTTRPVGEVMATLTSSTGTWGQGVYMMRDDDFFGFTTLGLIEGNYESGFADNVGSTPYDDMATDASDGSVDHLILEGAISVHLNCGGFTGEGNYRSFEKYLFPEGGNRGYDITLATEQFGRTVVINGTPVEETIGDTDLILAMAPLV